MKRRIIAGLLLLVAMNAGADDLPTLLVYQNPQEYSHEVRVGMMPYFSRWVLKGPAVDAAALAAFAPHFSEVGRCDGASGADVLVWLRPRIHYNPVASRYYAQVTAQFHLGNGKYLTTLKTTGEQPGPVQTVYADELVRKAFDTAMQDIARQYAADAAIQQAIADARAQDITRAPCAIIGAIPNP